MDLCYCGSGRKKSDCCLKIIDNKGQALTAEALMRSRYTAFVMGNEAYLIDSWHESRRPEALDLYSTPAWLGLRIIKTWHGGEGDKEGWVEFIASYRDDSGFGQLHERSYFLCEQGRWYYVEGEIKESPLPGRNTACPCGSGKKFKRCCGAS